MRGFMVMSCVLAMAIAAPQYNYNGPQYSTGGGQYYQNGGGILISSGGGNGGAIIVGGGGDGGFTSFNPAPALPSAESVKQYHKTRPASHRRVLPAILSKNIYYHSAPEEADEEIYEDNSSQQQRKHYNVVFIKAPHQSVKKIATQTAQALNEEKTAIYVLSKNNDVSEIRQALADSPNHIAKPEVFFIKYKTPEEAHHAQQTIQSQYDALGGSTAISNEGYAPISSVIGVLDGGYSNNGGAVISGGENVITTGGSTNFVQQTSAAGYLPPNKV